MNELLYVPPALIALAALPIVALSSRRTAHATGVLALLGTVVWGLLVPEGTGLTVRFLGFDVVAVSIDPFSRLMVLIFGGFGAAAVAFAYFAGTDTRHLLWGLGYVTASLWTVTVGDWLGLLVGWEAMAVASTMFVWLSGGSAIRAGYRYALAHAIGGSLLIAGVAFHLFATGGGTVPAADPTVLHFDSGISGGLAAILVGVGIGINAAILGLHAWLPGTYPAPHAATSVFLACYTTKTAVYAFHRAFPDGNMVLAYAGGAMAIYGAAYALAQKDMRRLLSYHIQAQVGFMLVGIGIGSAVGVAGGFAHLFNHILYKGLLFMAAGVIILRFGVNRLDEFGAIGRSAPIVFGAFLVGALSISGVPGFNGFVSKAMISDAVSADGSTLLYVMLWGGSVGTFASFAKFGYYAFLSGDPIEMSDAGRGHTVVLGAIAGACVLFGLYYSLLVQWLPFSETVTVAPYTTDKILTAVVYGVVGVGAFLAGRPVLQRLHGGIDVDRVHDPLVFYTTRGASTSLGNGFNAVDRAVGRCARGAKDAVRRPDLAIRRVVPTSIREQYEQRLVQTPGKTGFKLGVRMTVFVTGMVLGTTAIIALLVI